MSEQNAIIAAGVAAWQRIKEHSKRQAEDWYPVGDALVAGRSECLKLAGSNSLHTPAYRAHWRRWLDDNGFGDMDGHERLNAMWVAEHKTEVMRWRDGLDEAARRQANHPNVIVKHMGAGTEPAARGPKPKPEKQIHTIERRVEPPKANYSGPRPQRPDGDLIRRVAIAMQQSGSNDWYVRARIAVETLTLADLHALMPTKAAKPAQLALELHA